MRISPRLYQHRWKIAYIVILLFAMSVRFFKLGSVPGSLYWDEVAILVDAKSISQSGLDMHGGSWSQVIFPSYGDYKLPVYIWFASVSVQLFGITEWAVRVPSAVTGVLTVALAGYLAKLLTKNKLVGVSTAVVVAISPWSILFSRTAFEGHLAQGVVLLSIVMLCKWHDKWWGTTLSALLGAVATYSYFSVRFVWPVVFLLVLFFLKRHTLSTINVKSVLRLIAPVISGLVLFFVLLIPMRLSPLYENSNRFRLSAESILTTNQQVLDSNSYRELSGDTYFDRLAFHRYHLVIRELLKNYSDHLSFNFLFLTGDDNLRHGTGEHGLYLLVLLPALLIGIYKLAAKQPLLLFTLGGWWFIALLPAAVPVTTPHALRSLNALVPSAIMIGVGITSIMESLLRIRQKKTKYLSAILVLSLLLLNTFAFLYHYFTFYPADSQTAWQAGYKEVAQEVLIMREDVPVYVQVGDDRLYLWFMAYGKYTAIDFQAWPSRNFQYSSFDNIYFTKFPGWSNVSNYSSRAVLILRADEQEVLTQSDFIVLSKSEVLDADGNLLFVIAKIDKRL
ncbi:MAG: glycosyltransferase family 39 protein [bacterium]|nr:glycosyltransferase family 39 protein [bacterium]